jgi:diaminobutyrate-2-oxoglutarate transaminase
VRGRGMMLGLGWADSTIAGQVSKRAFQECVIAETTGSSDQVLKLLPPLTISEAELQRGLTGIENAVDSVLQNRGAHTALEAAE